MRALVQETATNLSLGANGGSAEVGIKDIRPRLEGYESALRGPALSAQLADRGQFVFIVRPQAADAATAFALLSNIQAVLTIKTLPLLGGDEQIVAGTTTTSFPYMQTDVSGQFLLFRGRLAFDVQDFGVCRATLALTNWNVASVTSLVTTQIFADVRLPQWERERLGTEEA